MMYENTRQGLLNEFTDKLADEAAPRSDRLYTTKAQRANARRMQEHFIRGLVADIIDRVAEDPENFKVGPDEW